MGRGEFEIAIGGLLDSPLLPGASCSIGCNNRIVIHGLNIVPPLGITDDILVALLGQ